MKKLQIHSRSAGETRRIAASLAAHIKKGDIIFFNGPIGAGKTVMVSAVAAAFGLRRRPSSASFGLMKKYKNKNITIYHMDLFRLACGEMFNLGFEEMLRDENSLILAEWPAAARDFFPRARLEVDIELRKGDGRVISFAARGKRYEDLLDNLGKTLCEKTKK
ncbi:MAG: tRNA (adenosine(37)-N6)-threonylcarbamoyltransferase complex ATPase subunit type 1 TsaE [Elusimicrobiota bacterium]|jgi:tRNA threonylcarbamoyladenosine biosynthesis protein TsaE|nr:tRNA (adenosine(37)-N6)-threonylcarbamoyltransferase complex ATPase subunit type 1 TsaE [Elusimicrobiota bacterium]